MEWVETTGKTLEEAKDAALDQLGVDEHDAEFEIVEEPRTGLFGRVRGDARVRARVRPTAPRPKVDRREPRGRRRGRTGDQRPGRGGARGQAARAEGSAVTTAGDGPGGSAPDTRGALAERTGGASRRPPGRRPRNDRPTDHDQERTEMTETELVSQGKVVRGFLTDLLDAFGLDGEVAVTPAEEGAVELAVTGSDLGLLIGPKGQTLQAIQELARTFLQRQLPGETHARVRIDVAGYRQRRREALARFAQQIAEDVKRSGVQKALEPMSPPDRKVVHDTVNEIEGVTTVSEGEDQRRRVVILPE